MRRDQFDAAFGQGRVQHVTVVRLVADHPRRCLRNEHEVEQLLHGLALVQAGGGYDSNLWREEAVWNAIEYINANPVRRGLCKTPEDWEWSSARWYAGVRPTLIEMDGPPPVPTPAGVTRGRR